MPPCLEHSGFEARLNSLEKDTGDSMKAAISAHRRIDGMKNWVIAGMTSLVIQLVATILGLIILWRNR